MRPRTAVLRWLQDRLGITALRKGAEHQLQELHLAAANYEQRIRRLERISAVTAWVEHATLQASPLVSVIMPTRNRAALLRGAVESVLRQVYPTWELLIIDDGSTDGTPEVLGGFADQRVRPLRIDHSGPGVARNTALDRARGELIAYLDDDNAMHPLWLKAVAWAFEARPDVDVLYGAWVIDDPARLNHPAGGDLPELWFTPWDRGLLLEQTLADQSAIAHRAGLPEARFEDDLRGYHDWTLLARLTADREPLVLPAIASLYSTADTGRLSTLPDDREMRARARERVREIQTAATNRR